MLRPLGLGWSEVDAQLPVGVVAPDEVNAGGCDAGSDILLLAELQHVLVTSFFAQVLALRQDGVHFQAPLLEFSGVLRVVLPEVVEKAQFGGELLAV